MSNEPTTDEYGNELLNEFEYTAEELAEIAKLSDETKDGNEDEKLDEDFVDDLLKTDPEIEVETVATPPTQEKEDETKLEPGTNPDSDTDDGQGQENIQPPAEEETEAPNYAEELEELDQKRQEAQGKITDALSKLEELGQQYDDGEIGQGKYDAQKARFEREIRLQEVEVTKLETEYQTLDATATAATDNYQRSEAQKFQKTLLDFVNEEQNAHLKANTHLATEFDSLLKTFSETGVFENMNYRQMIETVNNTLLIRHPELRTVKPKTDPEKKVETPVKPKKPTHENPTIPTSLASIPASEVNDQADPFAHIKKLNGIEYEAALQKLTPQQYSQFYGQEFVDM